nr:3-deoxy-7-phosphoheptulonate synthase [Clostridia bacterium]
MIVVMDHGATKDQVNKVIERLEKFGFAVHLSEGVERTVIGGIGDKNALPQMNLETLPGVEKVVEILHPYKLADRNFKPENTIVKIGDVEFGGSQIPVLAGPCAVESREQLLEAAHAVKAAGARVLRGGAYKPRTSPYAFQGLEEEGLKYLAEAREQTGLLIVTEVVDPRNVELVAEYSDILQIGARNMQNFLLLKEVAKTSRPVLLKRGPSSTIEEWL